MPEFLSHGSLYLLYISADLALISIKVIALGNIMNIWDFFRVMEV